MNNSLVPWFILVPETDKLELIDMDRALQNSVLDEINLLSRFIRQTFHSEKLNTACIGNIVQQLHIHIIGRDSSDYCWPNVVWGTERKRPYQKEDVKKIKDSLLKYLTTN